MDDERNVLNGSQEEWVAVLSAAVAAFQPEDEELVAVMAAALAAASQTRERRSPLVRPVMGYWKIAGRLEGYEGLF